MIRIGIPNTFDLEREIEEELRRRANSRDVKDLDALLLEVERVCNAYLQFVPGDA